MLRLLLISFTWADVPFSNLYGCEPRMVRVGRQPRFRLLVWVGRLSSAAASAAAAPFLELGELLERLVEARKQGVQLRHSRRGVIADLLVVAEGPFHQLDNAGEQGSDSQVLSPPPLRVPHGTS